MDAGHIIVGVLTTVAASWLVWAEIHSRRRQATQDGNESTNGQRIEGPVKTQGKSSRPVKH